MRKIASHEIYQLTAMLQTESLGLATNKATREIVQDEELKQQLGSMIQAGEMRIKGLQQFINENEIPMAEVH